MVSLGVPNLSAEAYNELMCTHWLWSRVAAERVLHFQTDSLLCRPGADAFERYAYVGAVWKSDDAWCA